MSILRNIELRMAMDRALTEGGAAGDWRLDPVRTGVWFRAKAFWGLRTANGTFQSVSGTGKVTPDGLICGTVAIRADSVATGRAGWDRRLRSRNLFDVDGHPELVLTVASGDRIGNGRLLLTAEVTVAGTTSPVFMNAEVALLDDTDVQLLVDFVVSRSALGLGWNRFGLIGNKVHVQASVHFSLAEAMRAGAVGRLDAEAA